MKHRILSSGLVLAALLSAVPSVDAQPSLRLAKSRAGDADFGPVPRVRFAALDVTALRTEDQAAEVFGGPMRFAVGHPVLITPESHGYWDREGALSRWRLRVSASDAKSLNFGFGRFALSPGARLSIYAADASKGLEPYTFASNPPAGELWTPILEASDAVLELLVPEHERAAVVLELTQISQGYRSFTAPDLEKSGSCNVDVVCPEGDGHRDVIRSVAMYSINGVRACSGAMINNTARNFRPFFLTAAHCGVGPGNAASVVSYWLFENPTCRAPDSPESGDDGDGSLSRSLAGATFRAGYAPSDFTLLEFNSAPPSGHRVHWAGWDKGGGAPNRAVTVHHPGTDEKRISFEDQPLSVTSLGGTASPGAGTHLRVTDWDLGTTEPGSSGAPLFNSSRRIVGQLHGGQALCGNNLSDWYGRLAVSWTGGGSASTRLSDWLDPTGSGVGSLSGGQPGSGTGTTPAAPSNLTAVVQSTTEVLLSWGDNSANETSFRVEFRPQGGSFAEIGSVGANTASAVVTGLTPNTTYEFRVRARNSAGNSAYSNTATATTEPPIPAAPTGLEVTPLSGDSVELSWVDQSANETAFEVELREIAQISAGGASTFLAGTFESLGTVGANSDGAIVENLLPNRVYNLRVRAVGSAGASAFTSEVTVTPQTTAGTCTGGVNELCLRGGRFRVQTLFNNFRPGGTRGDATSIAQSDQSGFFWFFNPTNVELVVKVLDGSGINGFYWTFFGALSDVEYWIVVTDTDNGQRKTYYNPPRRVCGELDSSSLPALGATTASVATAFTSAGLLPFAVSETTTSPPLNKGAACTPGAETLCLRDNRFALTLHWKNQRNGQEGEGGAIDSTTSDQVGFFWFFNPTNVELVVKVLDGTAINGHYWVLWGGLTDVEYDITVTDTATGASKVFHNPPGSTCGGADNEAFDD